jgi:hypothetical protein
MSQVTAALQAAALAFGLARAIPGRAGWFSGLGGPAILAVGAAGLAWAMCDKFPGSAALAVSAGTRAVGYGAMLLVFARSLRDGQEPLVTRIARQIDPGMTPRRLAYTRAVTWLWTGFFSFNLLAALAAFQLDLPWFVAWAGIPLAGLLFAVELAFRAVWFRGERRGSASDMAHVFLRRAKMPQDRP